MPLFKELFVAKLLEEAMGVVIREVRVRYHASIVSVRVPIDDSARAELREAIERALRLREPVDRPSIAENERLCKSWPIRDVGASQIGAGQGLAANVRHEHMGGGE